MIIGHLLLRYLISIRVWGIAYVYSDIGLSTTFYKINETAPHFLFFLTAGARSQNFNYEENSSIPIRPRHAFGDRM